MVVNVLCRDCICLSFQLEILENKEIPDLNAKLEEIEREVQTIEEEITEVRHVTTINCVVELNCIQLGVKGLFYENWCVIYRTKLSSTIMDNTLETLYQISTYSGYLNTPLPHFNVDNVAMWSKQSRVNCKRQETTLSGGRGGLNILYPLVSQDIREKCVIFVCFNYFCP